MPICFKIDLHPVTDQSLGMIVTGGLAEIALDPTVAKVLNFDPKPQRFVAFIVFWGVAQL